MAVTYSQNGVIVRPNETPYNVIGGRKYKTVIMPDGKEWLAENLDFKFCDVGGSYSIDYAMAWYYNNDEQSYGIDGTYKCGLIYNRYAAVALNACRRLVCPGWHLPNKSEWDALATACGGASTAGTKLKAADNSIVSGFPSGFGGTDDYGFSVLPGGQYFEGSFRLFGTDGNFHMNDDGNTYFTAGTQSMNQDTRSYPRYGFYIRLVRDAS